MLVGFSVSYCIADIMDKKVDPRDVAVIIGGTHFDETCVDELINGYVKSSVWAKYDREELKDTIMLLYNSGIIHQPRNFIYGAPSTHWYTHWMRLVEEPENLTDAAQTAYNNFIMLATLTNKKVDIYD
jgi:hypothetical protein